MQIRKHIEEVLDLLNRQEWVAQLLVRLFVGYFFAETGWGKLHNLDGFAQRFAGWGIPHPYFNAALSAYTEFVGGLLTMFGIGTRLVAIPMIINMLVAMLKVNLKRVATLDDFVELDEPLYALTYLWLLLSGPGWVSIDYLARQVFDRAGHDSRHKCHMRKAPASSPALMNGAGAAMAPSIGQKCGDPRILI
jgi:putative oxidoreductase